MKKLRWYLLVSLAVLIGLYPLRYVIVKQNFGLLTTKPLELLQDTVWNTFFYTHIIFGGLALLVGCWQFSQKLLTTNKPLHRKLGKSYIVFVALSGFSGLYIAAFATGGWVSSLGFGSLGIIWLASTYTAYSAVKQGNIVLHQQMMTYSYAACFAAVTLRVWLPLLIITFQDFLIAYKIVAWLSWLPNMAVAYIRNQDVKQSLL
ncbi:MAG: DUF2306 domain-containing protein [Thermoflexibacteraceae bacterium]|jgi:uncharacterized membrane protein